MPLFEVIIKSQKHFAVLNEELRTYIAGIGLKCSELAVRACGGGIGLGAPAKFAYNTPALVSV